MAGSSQMPIDDCDRPEPFDQAGEVVTGRRTPQPPANRWRDALLARTRDAIEFRRRPALLIARYFCYAAEE
jgi:hypothetical protein